LLGFDKNNLTAHLLNASKWMRPRVFRTPAIASSLLFINIHSVGKNRKYPNQAEAARRHSRLFHCSVSHHCNTTQYQPDLLDALPFQQGRLVSVSAFTA
jgi:hypothetical protein